MPRRTRMAISEGISLAFKALDRDCDDRLGVEDLCKAFSQVPGLEEKSETLADLAAGLATRQPEHGSGITLNMLIDIINQYRGENVQKHEVSIAHHFCHPDGSGHVGPAALTDVLQLLGLELSHAEAKEMIREFDKDEDGLLTSEELSHFMLQ